MLERLNDSLTHIEEHLREPLEVAELARIALTSEYHFRRMFSALAGMGPAEYIRRRRLTVAGAEVLAGERTLLQIATRYGYGSGEGFARAFRAVHGVGPAEARRTGAVLRSQPRVSFRLVVEGSSSMEYRIVDKDGMQVVGLRARVPLIHEGRNPAIEAFVRGLDRDTVGRLAALSDQEPRGIVAVVDDLAAGRKEETELDYWHGVVTGAPAPEDAETLTIPAGTWAVFTTSGQVPQAIQHLWRDVFTQWFPSNPYRSRPAPEILRTVSSADGSEVEAELWIPVERVTG